MGAAVFFDRDGVLNVDDAYVYRQDQWKWIEGAVEAIALANSLGYAVVVVTNQSGVARGYYTEDDVKALHRYAAADAERAGARIDAFYYCPHGPNDDCECRKPLPGMIEAAMADLGLSREGSLLIGDNPTDVQAAEAAGIQGHLFRAGNLVEFLRSILRTNGYEIHT